LARGFSSAVFGKVTRFGDGGGGRGGGGCGGGGRGGDSREYMVGRPRSCGGGDTDRMRCEVERSGRGGGGGAGEVAIRGSIWSGDRRTVAAEILIG
jgi:hypothetical protein